MPPSLRAPPGGLGTSSVELTSVASSDFVGISRPLVTTFADLVEASLMTYVTGDTGNPSSEAASLRFAGYRLGGLSEFTTVTMDLSENGGATPDAWQTTTFDDTSTVWQTNMAGSFCIISDPCLLSEFKTQYPHANIIGLTVAIGTGLPANTSYFDDVSLTITEVTDTWDFELAAAPTPTDPTPTPIPTPTPTPTPTPIPTPTRPRTRRVRSSVTRCRRQPAPT